MSAAERAVTLKSPGEVSEVTPLETVGRSPISKPMIELISVPQLLDSPRYRGLWLDNGRNWARPDSVALKALCEAKASLEKSADALGRSPTSIAWRASDTGLILPPEWREAIRPKRKPASQGAVLQYPYIATVRGEHETLLAVNSLVPHGLPTHLRADICQEIMLALWTKEVELTALQSDPRIVRAFITKTRKANYEGGGYALSLDTPLADGRSWYDILPSE